MAVIAHRMCWVNLLCNSNPLFRLPLCTKEENMYWLNSILTNCSWAGREGSSTSPHVDLLVLVYQRARHILTATHHPAAGRKPTAWGAVCASHRCHTNRLSLSMQCHKAIVDCRHGFPTAINGFTLLYWQKEKLFLCPSKLEFPECCVRGECWG